MVILNALEDEVVGVTELTVGVELEEVLK